MAGVADPDRRDHGRSTGGLRIQSVSRDWEPSNVSNWVRGSPEAHAEHPHEIPRHSNWNETSPHAGQAITVFWRLEKGIQPPSTAPCARDIAQHGSLAKTTIHKRQDLQYRTRTTIAEQGAESGIAPFEVDDGGAPVADHR